LAWGIILAGWWLRDDAEIRVLNQMRQIGRFRISLSILPIGQISNFFVDFA
jgi:hypothetical protein